MKVDGHATERGKGAAIGRCTSRAGSRRMGSALNANTDLSYFDLIVPREGEPVTSNGSMCCPGKLKISASKIGSSSFC